MLTTVRVLYQVDEMVQYTEKWEEGLMIWWSKLLHFRAEIRWPTLTFRMRRWWASLREEFTSWSTDTYKRLSLTHFIVTKFISTPNKTVYIFTVKTILYLPFEHITVRIRLISEWTFNNGYCNLQRRSETDSQRERLLERAVTFEPTLAIPAAFPLNPKTIQTITQHPPLRHPTPVAQVFSQIFFSKSHQRQLCRDTAERSPLILHAGKALRTIFKKFYNQHNTAWNKVL